MVSISTNSKSNSGTQAQGMNYKGALALLTSLFFMWGFLTCMNDILIPHLKGLFDLSITQAMLVQFTFFGAYFLMSLPAGWIIGKIGYKMGIVTGLGVAAMGAALFFPAAAFLSYGFFLFALFVLAVGIVVLQVAANPFVAELGTPETASSRLNLTQGFNSLGTTVAPIFGAYLILDNTSIDSAGKAEAVQMPYLGLAIALAVIAVIFALVKLPKIQEVEEEKAEGSVWKFRHLILGAVAIFTYVGAEVSIGSALVMYFGDEGLHLFGEAEAASYVSVFWGGAMIGRFIGSAIMQKVSASKVLAFNSVMVVALVVVSMLTNGYVAMWSLVLVGLFNSIMFPTIFTLAIDGLGRYTSQGSGVLCLAIVGGAIIPMIMGVLADNFGLRNAFALTIICYGYILFYALRGHKHN
ncbi:glucose/galactose MFS transporter [Labilibaculum sp. A4]|uniref:Glucose/galactose MFS transporter n=1 Tax=Labilibaculum euxinus TaxID=2686357 RepID=A0A425YEK2_9BACT|nr:sugar MFS transporter [Labilibaculum euxinus]MDQ1771960.1 sugar MFS transporter [Labilibaculum euxinus]MUP39455.1 glucose/galactose MFS transporter [Labilibaculum euxinus]MVB08660.1 glucose/galactose MFS transporter [Labilibaculum euxinus]MWN75689.1 glucose/galactose MFS transporter [Labilibaculum euxinus]